MSPKKPDKEILEIDVTKLRRMAQVMDTLFRIPGTNVKFGLDPLVGLIPVVGDLISAGISTAIVAAASKLGVSKWIQLRMAFNIFLNTAIGAIPGLGDLFSVWFKSNQRNYELLQKYLERQQK